MPAELPDGSGTGATSALPQPLLPRRPPFRGVTSSPGSRCSQPSCSSSTRRPSTGP
ncbi:hypothetical protein NKG05_00155 [Oerskovia sp. M15]